MLIHKKVPMRWRSFCLPKQGNKLEEYEDACAVNAEAGRFAVADGASESSFAGLWARLLVDGFVKPIEKPEPGSNWLAPLQRRWAGEVDGMTLPWYAEDKRSQGGFATFLGFVIKQGTQTETGSFGEWQALAVGDSCLVQVRQDALIYAFPLTMSNEFGNHPILIGSRGDPVDQLAQRQRRENGGWQTGDHFYLMTDALAQWFLHTCEQGRKPWRAFHKLLDANSPDSLFESFVHELRAKEGLRNDDVTLIPIEL